MVDRKGNKEKRTNLKSADVWLIHPTRSLRVSMISHGKDAVKFSQAGEIGRAHV